jgi:hypothetical protein
MFALDFLDNLSIQEISSTSPRLAKKDSNPPATFMGIRVHKDGSIFPSEALVQKFNLEYPKATIINKQLFDVESGAPLKDAEGNPVTKRTVETPEGHFGFDVFSLHNWSQVENRLQMSNVLLVAVTPKKADKVDLFSNTKYNDDGTPKSSVLDQGAGTFGKDSLLPMLKEVYGCNVEDMDYLDLEINVAKNIRNVAPNGIFNLPKLITRGEKKGKADFVRRENVDIFPLTVVTDSVAAVLEESNAEIAVPAAPSMAGIPSA